MLNHPQHKRGLTKSIESLEGIRQSLKSQAYSIDSLRGFEGAAASNYFTGLSCA